MCQLVLVQCVVALLYAETAQRWGARSWARAWRAWRTRCMQWRRCGQDLGCPENLLCTAAQRVAGLLDAEAAARWERLELDQSLARMADVVHCPRCATPCIEDGGDHCAQCPKCLFAFCTLCNDSWHGRSIQARTRAPHGTARADAGCAAACSPLCNVTASPACSAPSACLWSACCATAPWLGRSMPVHK